MLKCAPQPGGSDCALGAHEAQDVKRGLFEIGVEGIYDPSLSLSVGFPAVHITTESSTKNLDFPQRKWRREKIYQRDQNCV